MLRRRKVDVPIATRKDVCNHLIWKSAFCIRFVTCSSCIYSISRAGHRKTASSRTAYLLQNHRESTPPQSACDILVVTTNLRSSVREILFNSLIRQASLQEQVIQLTTQTLCYVCTSRLNWCFRCKPNHPSYAAAATLKAVTPSVHYQVILLFSQIGYVNRFSRFHIEETFRTPDISCEKSKVYS